MREDIKRGDMVVIRKQYKTLGPSESTGIVFTVDPLVLCPVSGHGYRAVVVDENLDISVVTVRKSGFLLRPLNILKSLSIKRK